MKMLLLGFASRLHGELYYKSMFQEVTDILSVFKDLEIYKDIITEPVTIDVNNYELIIAYLLTGGTSKLAYKVLMSTDRKPVLIIAHSKHNSLASALSLRTKLLDAGVKVKLIYFLDKNDLLMKFTRFYKGVVAGYSLKYLRIIEINDYPETSDEGKRFADRFGAEIIHVNYDELWRIAGEATINDIRELENLVHQYIDLSGTNKQYLDKVLRIYYALRKLLSIHGANAIVIDCFPLVLKYNITPCLAVAMMNAEGIPTACENDYYSLVSLFISLALTGYPGWISNPSGITSDGYLRFAHCTIAPVLGRNCFLTTHFETGNPYAVVCRFRADKVLFIRVDKGFDGLTIYRGKVVRSGLLEPGYCRTQLIIDTGTLKPEEFVEKATGNHHVFIPWSKRLIESLKHMAWWMNWRIEIRN